MNEISFEKSKTFATKRKKLSVSDNKLKAPEGFVRLG